jgi:hypothetical protein
VGRDGIQRDPYAPTVDGGYDLRAIRNMTGGRQNVLIECKRYARPAWESI